jgi:hypothetical protein
VKAGETEVTERIRGVSESWGDGGEGKEKRGDVKAGETELKEMIRGVSESWGDRGEGKGKRGE